MQFCKSAKKTAHFACIFAQIFASTKKKPYLCRRKDLKNNIDMKKVTFVFHQTEEEQQAAMDRILHMRESWKAHVQSVRNLQHA